MRAYMRTSLVVAAVGSLGAVAACHMFDVSNPGPVLSDFLTDPKAAPAIVNGAGRDLSDALNWIAYTGGAITREVFPAGSTGSFGISAQQQVGKLLDDDTNEYWQRAQRARFEAEDGADKLKQSLGANFAKDTLAAKILLWAAYANRLLGENMCDAVINGGPKLASYTVYRWECAVRASVVMGFVGAGGLGQLMDQSMKMLNGGEASTILLTFLLLVLLADALSAALRRLLA